MVKTTKFMNWQNLLQKSNPTSMMESDCSFYLDVSNVIWEG